MSKFNDAFGSAAKTLMSVFGETTPATYMPATGSAQSLNVVVEHDVVFYKHAPHGFINVGIIGLVKPTRVFRR